MAKVMTIRPPEELREKIKEKANSKGYTVNQMVLQILWEWIGEQDRRRITNDHVILKKGE